MKRNLRLLMTALLATTVSACSSWLQGLKQGITGEDPATTASLQTQQINRTPSSTPLMTDELASKPPVAKRKQDPFDATGPVSDGSLWNGETQDNFYFSKNVLHKLGDILIVRIEPEVNDALNNRIATAFGRPTGPQVAADAGGAGGTGGTTEQKIDAPAGEDNAAKTAGTDARAPAAVEAKTKYVEVDEVTVRIAENLPRGAYRVEGTKRVFIKSSPYVLKYSGVIRDEDLGPSNMITSSKVIDSKMELVK